MCLAEDKIDKDDMCLANEAQIYKIVWDLFFDYSDMNIILNYVAAEILLCMSSGKLVKIGKLKDA